MTEQRCWCGAYVEHTEDGWTCDACMGEYDPELDLRPSGYEYNGTEWVSAE